VGAVVSPDTIERIKEVLGPLGCLDDPAQIAPYVIEWRDLFRGRTPLVARPATTREVCEVVRICHDTRTPFVPQGGNTSLCGGSVPHESGDEIVLSLSRMNRVRELDAPGYTMTAEAGCVLADIQRTARGADRLFPLSLAAEGSCQLGGNLATNAGGTAVLRYGSARDLVLGLEVVLPDGRVWEGLRGLRKDNTGYDLKQLFLGAEGTLGVITAACVKLFPQPRDVQTAWAALPSVDASLALLSLARDTSGDALTAFELVGRVGLEYVLRHIPGAVDPLPSPHPWYALLELSGGRARGDLRRTLETLLEDAFGRALVRDAVVAQGSAHSAALWRLRESMSEAQKREGVSIKHDVSVPVARVPEFIARATAALEAALPGVRVVAFGHVGDGNIHFNPMQPADADPSAFAGEWERVSRIVHDLVHALGGSISAEHGIGRLKRDELRRYKSDTELELMRRIKHALDPLGICNPGKVV
jgi:FAD/FMN-containing dehydrogenase